MPHCCREEEAVSRWKDRPPGGAMLASSAIRRRVPQLLLPTQGAAERTSRAHERMESGEGRYDGQTGGGGGSGLHCSAHALILSDLLYRAAAEAACAPPSHNTRAQSPFSATDSTVKPPVTARCNCNTKRRSNAQRQTVFVKQDLFCVTQQIRFSFYTCQSTTTSGHD